MLGPKAEEKQALLESMDQREKGMCPGNYHQREACQAAAAEKAGQQGQGRGHLASGKRRDRGGRVWPRGAGGGGRGRATGERGAFRRARQDWPRRLRVPQGLGDRAASGRGCERAERGVEKRAKGGVIRAGEAGPLKDREAGPAGPAWARPGRGGPVWAAATEAPAPTAGGLRFAAAPRSRDPWPLPAGCSLHRLFAFRRPAPVG